MKIFLGSQLIGSYRGQLVIQSPHATVTIYDHEDNIVDSTLDVIMLGTYYIRVSPHTYYKVDNIRVNENQHYEENSLFDVVYGQSLEITVECSIADNIVQSDDNIKIISTGASLVVADHNLRIGG